MKSILYVYFGGDLSESVPGVQAKILSKIGSINSQGIDCQGLSFGDKEMTLNKGAALIFILPLKIKEKWRYFSSIQRNMLIYKELQNFLDLHPEFSYVIMRYPLATWSLKNFAKTNKGKVVFEHNSFEWDELKLEFVKQLKSFNFSLRPGNYFGFIEKAVLPLLRELFYPKIIFKHAKLGISVTKEIALKNNRKQSGYKNFVISNGIDTDQFQLTYKTNVNHKIKAFMLCGYQAPWHGIERLISSLKSAKLNFDFEITIIGNIENKLRKEILETKLPIKVMSQLNKKELDSFLFDFDFSFGTLALFKKNMMEACPLKVRESLSRGFPTVIGYDDTDLLNNEKFIYTVPNDGSVIDFNKIIDWYLELTNDEDIGVQIRSFAKQHLDSKVKMGQLSSILLKE